MNAGLNDEVQKRIFRVTRLSMIGRHWTEESTKHEKPSANFTTDGHLYNFYADVLLLVDFHFLIKQFKTKLYHYFHKTTQDEWRGTLGSFFLNLSQIWRKNRQSSFRSERYVYIERERERQRSSEGGQQSKMIQAQFHSRKEGLRARSCRQGTI